MKKKKFVSIVLLAVVCVLPILCILMIHHLSLCACLEKMGTGNFGESSCLTSMTRNSIETRLALYDAFVEERVSCGIYLDDKASTENTIRYMAFTKDYVNLPMQNGRFLEKEDFKKNNRVAVVGKNVENVYEKEGKQYIQSKDQEYYVLGEMGYEEDYYEFLRDADTVGVRVSLTGRLPGEERLFRLFMIAVRECLTNAVRHGDATELCILVEGDIENGKVGRGDDWLCIRNNGILPDGAVRLSGGLLNLQRNAQELGGTLSIQTEPEFAVKLRFPDHFVKPDDCLSVNLSRNDMDD